MAQSPIRLRCPSCHQKLRLLNVAEDKRSIHCPLCNAKVSLDRHRREQSASHAIPRKRQTFEPEVEYEEVEDEDYDEDYDPRPQRRRPRRRTSDSTWTFWKSLRIVLGTAGIVVLGYGAFKTFIDIVRFSQDPVLHNGITALRDGPALIFWMGITLWLWNVFDSYDWSELAKSLCIWGFGLILATTFLYLAIRFM